MQLHPAPGLTGPAQDKVEVEVPVGKLRIVIDSPNNGVSVVHANKQERIWCARVCVNDRMIPVDDDYITSITALQVFKLISLKSDQQFVCTAGSDLHETSCSDMLDP
jgi:hypothetical protein